MECIKSSKVSRDAVYLVLSEADKIRQAWEDVVGVTGIDVAWLISSQSKMRDR